MPITGSIYTDFQGLQRLHTAAEQHSPEAAREAAQQFESLFLGMMLKSARAATPGGGLLDSKRIQFFQSMLDHQVAVDLAQRGSIGLQPLIMRQLGLTVDPAAKQQEQSSLLAPDSVSRESAGRLSHSNPLSPARGRGDDKILPLTAARPPLRTAANPQWKPASALDFVRDLWPHAVAAARKLGVSARVLVAQAALETGWGKHVIQRGDGATSYNLFGIKAGSGWGGVRANVPTMEYRDGAAVREAAGFRTYRSLGDSFRDYVHLIRNNPRYRDAVAAAGDPSAYLRALQTAGYATDPHYADKIEAILRGNDIAGMAAGAAPTHEL